MTKPEPMRVEPVTLDGRHVRLEPLSLDHHAQLSAISDDAAIWRWMPYDCSTPENMRLMIEYWLHQQSIGASVCFATIDRATNQAAGSTTYMNIDASNHRLEIGGTWIAPRWQRTAVNTEAKHLMLRHAFEVLGCIRVEFKTDSLNEKSRTALLRIGAKQEGVFRNHMIMPDGRIRHSVYFSIIDSEWPQVKADLEARLAQPYPQSHIAHPKS
jgi:RimJ/RimL family protein N-acetyltransferase